MSRILREIVRRRPPFLPPPSSLHPPPFLNPNPNGLRLASEKEENLLQIYPSFSFGYFLNPIIPSGLVQSQLMVPLGGETERPGGMIWADSVKKKRKKKMNKHKYKKLRKRLRRKTKT